MKDISRSAYNIADLREIARRRLPKGLFEFMDRGTEDEVALRNNPHDRTCEYRLESSCWNG